MREFFSYKSGKFYFYDEFNSRELDSLLIRATILNETIRDLPILPELASSIEPDIMYSSIAGTAAIEGNPIPEDDVRRLVEGEDLKDYTLKDKQEIRNLIEAYDLLSKLRPSSNSLILTEKLVQTLHKLVTLNIPHEHNRPGKYRDGIVHVGAKDLGTGKEQKITVTGGSLTEEEIKTMIKDSEKFKKEDEKKKDKIMTMNEAESLVYSSEKMIEEYKSKVDKETITKIQTEIDELKEILKKENVEEIKSKLETVKKVSQEIGVKIYEQAAKEKEDSGSKVVDAEVVEDADSKKDSEKKAEEEPKKDSKDESKDEPKKE